MANKRAEAAICEPYDSIYKKDPGKERGFMRGLLKFADMSLSMALETCKK
jgi:hypothetical protein